MSDNEKPQFESARSTLVLNSQPADPADPMQADEDRMRRALGLYGDQPRPRPAPARNDPPPPARTVERFPGTTHHKRRFVHDGEVPVTLVHGLVSNRREHADGNGARGSNGQPTNRLEVAEAALASEIATRERTERALQETQATIHDLQTKLGHADLARQEAVETLHRERESSAELRAALEHAEERIAEARQAQTAAEQALAAWQDGIAETTEPLAELPAEPVLPRRRGRKPRALILAEQASAALPDLIEEQIEPPAELAAEPPPRRRGRKPRVQVAAEQELQELAGLQDPIAEPAEQPEEAPAPRRRGRKPRAQTMAEAAAVKPRKAAARGRPKKAAPAREPKPIRWWVNPRGKKKR